MRRARWNRPEREATPEEVWWNRRSVLRAMGFSGGALLGGMYACGLSVRGSVPRFTPATRDAGGAPDGGGDASSPDASELRVNTSDASTDGSGAPQPADWRDGLPYARSERYAVRERPVTPEEAATTFNNYYEFTPAKTRVHELVGGFVTRPWTMEITGLCHRPRTLDLDDLLREVSLEERLYRFRCVEAWAMTVPWTGVPLARVLDLAEPMSGATHVRFVTGQQEEAMPGVAAQSWYPWPYQEGLRMDEARNELAMLVVGMYGRVLPVQNGAPFRLIVPWKYGYKNAKAIRRIEFVDSEPATFWNTIAPDEYGFLSNVDPSVPHPRWSQEMERLIPDGDEVPTYRYNGYEEFVSHLYP